MVVLIIDDNLAIREAIKDVLVNAGYDVRITDDASEAPVLAFDQENDFIFLNADFAGNGLAIVDKMCGISQENNSDIILVCDRKASVPTDNPYIKAKLIKPFRSADILNSMDEVRNTVQGLDEFSASPKEDKYTFRRRDAYEYVSSMEDMNLEFGTSYVLFQDTPKMVYRTASSFGAAGNDLLVVSSVKQKAVKEKIKCKSVETIYLTTTSKNEFADVYKLGTTLDIISDFIKRTAHPTIVFDNLNILIEKNGINSVMVLINEIMKEKQFRNLSLIVSVNVHEFTDKDKNILKSKLKLYNPPAPKFVEGNKSKEKR